MGGASLHRVHKSVPRADPYSTPAVFVLSPVYNGFPLEEAILCRLPPPTAGSPTHTHTHPLGQTSRTITRRPGAGESTLITVGPDWRPVR